MSWAQLFAVVIAVAVIIVKCGGVWVVIDVDVVDVSKWTWVNRNVPITCCYWSPVKIVSNCFEWYWITLKNLCQPCEILPHSLCITLESTHTHILTSKLIVHDSAHMQMCMLAQSHGYLIDGAQWLQSQSLLCTYTIVWPAASSSPSCLAQALSCLSLSHVLYLRFLR